MMLACRHTANDNARRNVVDDHGAGADGAPGADRDLLSIGMAWERSSAKLPMPCADV